MALIIGSETADAGMSKAIYAEMDRLLSPPLQDAVNHAAPDAKPGAQKALDAAREGWKKLSYANAHGVITHITSNMDVFGVTTQGGFHVPVTGQTGAAPPADHTHSINLTPGVTGVVFTQNNDGTGRVR